MLESIAWQDYFTILTVLVAMYYACIGVIFYQQEIKTWWNKANKTQEDQIQTTHELPNFMGTTRPRTEQDQILIREELISTDELHLASVEINEPSIDTVDFRQEARQKHFSSLTEEIESLALVMNDASVEEVATLFQALLANYTMLVGTEFQERATNWISKTCQSRTPHAFTQEQVTKWWPSQE